MSLTIPERLAKQRKFYRYKYAYNLVYADNRELAKTGFATHSRIHGDKWRDEIRALANKIDMERKK
jgi:hypothetical protein